MGKDSDDSDEGLGGFAPDLPEGIVKEIVRSAASDSFGRPHGFDEVTVHFVGTDPTDGVEVCSSRTQNEPITFTLGKEKAIKGWELAIQTMRRGEISRFTMPREFIVGKDGTLPSNLPDKESLVFELELVSFVRRRDLFKDGGVIKRNTIEAIGTSRPKLDGEVIISLKACGIDGAIIDERSSFEYKMGSGSLGKLGKAVDKALRSIKKGGAASLECTEEYAYGSDHPGGATVELCLEEIYTTEDVSWYKNGTLMKKCIRESSDGGYPKEADNVRLQVETATDGADTLPGFTGPRMLEFTWGDGEVAEVFEAAVRKMQKSERAILTCTVPRYCCEAQLGLEKISAKRVEFKIELVEFQEDTIDILAYDAESKLEFATARKDVGGRFFKEQRFMMAFYRYEFVVKFLHEQFNDRRGEDKDKVEELRTACQLNQAACLLKVKDFQGAIRASTLVLDRKPGNVKALFRRATAHHERAEYMPAIRDLTKAVEVEPQNVEARRLLQQAKQAQREEDKSAKSMFSKMVVQDEAAVAP